MQSLSKRRTWYKVKLVSRYLTLLCPASQPDCIAVRALSFLIPISLSHLYSSDLYLELHPLSTMGLMIQKPEHVAGSAAPAILVGLFVSFGGILYG